MTLGYREFRVLLRHARQSTDGEAIPTKPDFIAIVSAVNEPAARREAENLVQMLKGMVIIDSIEPRAHDDRESLA